MEKGTSSNHRFFRGELLIFGGVTHFYILLDTSKCSMFQEEVQLFFWKPNNYHTTKTPFGAGPKMSPYAPETDLRSSLDPIRPERKSKTRWNLQTRCGKNTSGFCFPVVFSENLFHGVNKVSEVWGVECVIVSAWNSGNKSVNICDSMLWKDANIVGVWSNYSDRKHDLGPQKGWEILVVRYYILARWYFMVRFLLLLFGGWVVCFNILGARER